MRGKNKMKGNCGIILRDFATQPYTKMTFINEKKGLRAIAKAVRGLGDHHLAESGHHDEDKDGHQLDKQGQASLWRENTSPCS